MNSVLKNIKMTPVVTEKSLMAQSSGKYTFWVNLDATKNQIAAVFKNVFNQEPLRVNTVVIKGKTKTNWKTRKPIQKQDRKKAIITVAKDAKLEILNLKK